MSAASGREITVQFALVEGTAKDPEDFALQSGKTNTLTFMPGVTSMNLPIDIIADVHDEDSENFTVTLSSPNNATLRTDDDETTITIMDNDARTRGLNC